MGNTTKFKSSNDEWHHVDSKTKDFNPLMWFTRDMSANNENITLKELWIHTDETKDRAAHQWVSLFTGWVGWQCILIQTSRHHPVGHNTHSILNTCVFSWDLLTIAKASNAAFSQTTEVDGALLSKEKEKKQIITLYNSSGCKRYHWHPFLSWDLHSSGQASGISMLPIWSGCTCDIVEGVNNINITLQTICQWLFISICEIWSDKWSR